MRLLLFPVVIFAVTIATCLGCWMFSVGNDEMYARKFKDKAKGAAILSGGISLIASALVLTFMALAYVFGG